MNSKIASVKINQRLEKLDRSDYDNIDKFQKEEAVNKAATDLVRWIVKSEDEFNRLREDDIQHLLKEHKMSKVNRDIYVESAKLPSDYMFFKRLSPKCDKGLCKDVYISATMVEEANVDSLLMDYSSQPSFDFEECFFTLMGNKFRVYHNKDFNITELRLIYYRKPTRISFDPADLVTEWEWNESTADLLIDMAVQILAGDTANVEAYQIAAQRNASNI